MLQSSIIRFICTKHKSLEWDSVKGQLCVGHEVRGEETPLRFERNSGPRRGLKACHFGNKSYKVSYEFQSYYN